jgi:hypothetical protein
MCSLPFNEGKCVKNSGNNLLILGRRVRAFKKLKKECLENSNGTIERIAINYFDRTSYLSFWGGEPHRHNITEREFKEKCESSLSSNNINMNTT